MWAVADIDNSKVVARGTDIASFIKWMTTTRRDKSSTIYFHNLRFDGAFLLSHLELNGYKNVKNFTDDCNKEYKSLINEMGVWYGLSFRFKKADYYLRVNIYDSFKKIPLSLEEIAKAYNLDVLKGTHDHEKYRPLGYKPTKEEWEYVDTDVLIQAKALKLHLENKMDKMTLSSDAYNNFRSRFTKKQFDVYFPSLAQHEWDYIRKAYKGGWTYSMPNKRNIVYNDVLSYDVNSLYPYAMLQDLPFGEPKTFKGKYVPNKYMPLYIQTIEVSFKLKDGFLPTLQNSSLGRYAKDLFFTDSENEIIELTLTNIDLDIFLRHHDIYHIKYLHGSMFYSSNNLFTEYISEWGAVKEHSTDGIRQIAKAMLNSLYGKFGTNPKHRDKIPYIDEDDILRFKLGEEETSLYLKYLPIAVFTTANARAVQINSAQKLYKHFLYGDTDSLKLVDISEEEVEKILNVHPTKLGSWKLEDTYKDFKAIKAKAYAYTLYDDDNCHVVASGLPQKVKQEITSLDDFRVGFTTDSKLVQRHVKGGVILKPSRHEIK